MLMSPKRVGRTARLGALEAITGSDRRPSKCFAMTAATLALWFISLGCRDSATNGAPPAMLPSGFLSVKGPQFVGPDGAPVRIASVGLTGMNVVGGRLGLVGPFKGIEGRVEAMKAMGFNCVRVDWIGKTLDDPGAMAQLDQFVASCKGAGLKVIFNNHNNGSTRPSGVRMGTHAQIEQPK